jgi:SAM-dependent methyltransferase
LTVVDCNRVTSNRRLVFGEVADLYDRSRPSYPPALIEDVIEYAGSADALEVGAGTGKATVLFAQRGISVHAVEPSAQMAAIARANCAAYARVTVEQVDFEHYSPNGRTFGLLYSAQAWHWVAPEVRYVKARAVLRAGGALAAFWNRPRWTESPLRDELNEAYERAAPELARDPGPMHPAVEPPELREDWKQELRAVPGFGHAETRVYEWFHEYPTDRYLELLRTHSDHIVLGAERLAQLLAEVETVIDEHGGSIPVSYVTVLRLARAG